jgi:DNA-binding response OmpR family regulator
LQLRITNTGIGIKEPDHQRIFDRFEVLDRLEKQVVKGHTSTGIGLALCKSLTELLHGTIGLESDGETFTSFFVSLPKQEIDSTELPQDAEVSSEQVHHKVFKTNRPEIKNDISVIPDTTKNGLLLIVDDDPDICELLKEFLIEKYEIAIAGNGQEAIELMKLRLPVLIISDVMMPVMDGVEFLKLMKAQELTRHIPVILLSTKGSIESQIEGLETGADAYLSKPFHPRHLEAMIERLLQRNKTLLDFSESPYAAITQFGGKTIHKEDKELILRITSIIYDNIDNESLSVDLLADELALSRMQVYRKIKEITNQTPTEYMRFIRLKHAEKLLKTTNKTVLEIMYACGFNNKSYFYREFAKMFNDTPNEYRKKL